MPLVISDETLKDAKLTEQQARVEIACRLFDADKLHLWPAAKLAGMTRDEFLWELKLRNIPAFRLTAEDLEQDSQSIAHFLAHRSKA